MVRRVWATAGLPTKKAGEIIWTLASPDVGRMLCDELGWTQTQHARWLADTLTQTLLPGEDQQQLLERVRCV